MKKEINKAFVSPKKKIERNGSTLSRLYSCFLNCTTSHFAKIVVDNEDEGCVYRLVNKFQANTSFTTTTATMSLSSKIRLEGATKPVRN